MKVLSRLVPIAGNLLTLYGSFFHAATFQALNPSAVQLTQIYTDSLRWSAAGIGLLLVGLSLQLRQVEAALKGEEPEE